MTMELKIGDGFEYGKLWKGADSGFNSFSELDDAEEFISNYYSSLGNKRLKYVGRGGDSLFTEKKSTAGSKSVYTVSRINDGGQEFVGTSLRLATFASSNTRGASGRYDMQGDLGSRNVEVSYAINDDLAVVASGSEPTGQNLLYNGRNHFVIILSDGLGSEFQYAFYFGNSAWQGSSQDGYVSGATALTILGDNTQGNQSAWKIHYVRVWENAGKIRIRFTTSDKRIVRYEETLPAGFTLKAILFLNSNGGNIDDFNIWEADAAEEAAWNTNFATQTFDYQSHIKHGVLSDLRASPTGNVEGTTNGDTDDWAFSAVSALADMSDGEKNTFGIATPNQRGYLQNKSFAYIASDIGYNSNAVNCLSFKGSDISDDDGEDSRVTFKRAASAGSVGIDVNSQAASERGVINGFIGQGSPSYAVLNPVPADDDFIGTVRLI